MGSNADMYEFKGDTTQDSEEALEQYGYALRCSDIKPKQKEQIKLNISEILKRLREFL